MGNQEIPARRRDLCVGRARGRLRFAARLAPSRNSSSLALAARANGADANSRQRRTAPESPSASRSSSAVRAGSPAASATVALGHEALEPVGDRAVQDRVLDHVPGRTSDDELTDAARPRTRLAELRNPQLDGLLPRFPAARPPTARRSAGRSRNTHADSRVQQQERQERTCFHLRRRADSARPEPRVAQVPGGRAQRHLLHSELESPRAPRGRKSASIPTTRIS